MEISFPAELTILKPFQQLLTGLIKIIVTNQEFPSKVDSHNKYVLEGNSLPVLVLV